MPTVITKKSTVVGKVPLDTDLQVGELAVNTADKILYSKHSDNQVVKIGFDPAVPGPIGSTTPSTVAATNVTVSGTIASPTSIQFGSGSATTLAAGKAWYDENTGSFNLGMGGGNITQQIGEEVFTYGKASSAITGQTLLQAIYRTGAVGASGVITFAPVTSGITDANLIVGVGTEDIALNGFGRITSVGIVRGINTSGSTYSETWVDNDTIWYKASTGGLTNVKPTSGILVSVGSIILAHASTGSIQVKVQVSSVTDLASPGAIGETTPDSIKTTKATVVSGTVTSSVPAVNVTQTWNNAAVPFTAEVTNVTNTASAAASLLRDWQIGGVSMVSITKAGKILVPASAISNTAGIFAQDAQSTCGISFGYGGSNNAITFFNNGEKLRGTSGVYRFHKLSLSSAGDMGNDAVVLWGTSSGQGEVNNGTTGSYRDWKVRNLIATGSISTGLSAKTADYTLTANDGTITADSTSAAITLTLETAVGHTRIHAFKKVAGANLVTIDGNASETIDGATSITLTDRCVLQSNGTEWKQIA